eukprot:c20245_g1_i1.p1 GENE.c20245_g1_i1~~c20245_g1_i1.p1  ORF type:complete len:803 (+),score=125.99 c20245_g1_i1:66-2474(+)
MQADCVPLDALDWMVEGEGLPSVSVFGFEEPKANFIVKERPTSSIAQTDISLGAGASWLWGDQAASPSSFTSPARRKSAPSAAVVGSPNGSARNSSPHWNEQFLTNPNSPLRTHIPDAGLAPPHEPLFPTRSIHKSSWAQPQIHRHSSEDELSSASRHSQNFEADTERDEGQAFKRAGPSRRDSWEDDFDNSLFAMCRLDDEERQDNQPADRLRTNSLQHLRNLTSREPQITRLSPHARPFIQRSMAGPPFTSPLPAPAVPYDVLASPSATAHFSSFTSDGSSPAGSPALRSHAFSGHSQLASNSLLNSGVYGTSPSVLPFNQSPQQMPSPTMGAQGMVDLQRSSNESNDGSLYGILSSMHFPPAVTIELETALSTNKLLLADVDSRLRATIRDVGEDLAAEAIREFLACDVRRINNKAAFLMSIIHKKRISACDPSDSLMSESVGRLAPSVRSSLNQLVTQGVLRTCDIDQRLLSALADLPEEYALQVVNDFACCDMDKIKNRTTYFMSLIHHTKLKQKPFSPHGTVTSIPIAVASALEALHARQLLHQSQVDRRLIASLSQLTAPALDEVLSGYMATDISKVKNPTAYLMSLIHKHTRARVDSSGRLSSDSTPPSPRHMYESNFGYGSEPPSPDLHRRSMSSTPTHTPHFSPSSPSRFPVSPLTSFSDHQQPQQPPSAAFSPLSLPANFAYDPSRTNPASPRLPPGPGTSLPAMQSLPRAEVIRCVCGRKQCHCVRAVHEVFCKADAEVYFTPFARMDLRTLLSMEPEELAHYGIPMVPRSRLMQLFSSLRQCMPNDFWN